MSRKLVLVNAGHDLAETVEIDHPTARVLGQPIRQKVRRVVTQTILDRWLARRGIDERQWRAGDRLRATMYRAGLEPRVTMNLQAQRGSPDPGQMLPAGEAQTQARAEMRRALSVLPSRLAGIAVAVCGDQETPGAYLAREGKRGRWAETLGRDRLRLALDLLADFYGM
jgi:hypothetical protein